MGNQGIEGGSRYFLQGRVKITGNKIIEMALFMGRILLFGDTKTLNSQWSPIVSPAVMRYLLIKLNVFRPCSIRPWIFSNTAIVIKHTAERIQLVGNIAISQIKVSNVFGSRGLKSKANISPMIMWSKRWIRNPGSLSQ